MHNKGNYVVSLGEVARWMAAQAEALGVEIYPGFAASEVLFHEDGSVKGVATASAGSARTASGPITTHPAWNCTRARPSWPRLPRVADQGPVRALRPGRECDPQTYSIGIKELWEIDPSRPQAGPDRPHDRLADGPRDLWRVVDVPRGRQPGLDRFVIGLDYQNPYLPLRRVPAFQDPSGDPVLEGGRRISYGAKVGGWGSSRSPGSPFPGGCIVGERRGLPQRAKIKGNHTAMKSGMVCAEAVFEHLVSDAKGRE